MTAESPLAPVGTRLGGLKQDLDWAGRRGGHENRWKIGIGNPALTALG